MFVCYESDEFGSQQWARRSCRGISRLAGGDLRRRVSFRSFLPSRQPSLSLPALDTYKMNTFASSAAAPSQALFLAASVHLTSTPSAASLSSSTKLQVSSHLPSLPSPRRRNILETHRSHIPNLALCSLQTLHHSPHLSSHESTEFLGSRRTGQVGHLGSFGEEIRRRGRRTG